MFKKWSIRQSLNIWQVPYMYVNKTYIQYKNQRWTWLVTCIAYNKKKNNQVNLLPILIMFLQYWISKNLICLSTARWTLNRKYKLPALVNTFPRDAEAWCALATVCLILCVMFDQLDYSVYQKSKIYLYIVYMHNDSAVYSTMVIEVFSSKFVHYGINR